MAKGSVLEGVEVKNVTIEGVEMTVVSGRVKRSNMMITATSRKDSGLWAVNTLSGYNATIKAPTGRKAGDPIAFVLDFMDRLGATYRPATPLSRRSLGRKWDAASRYVPCPDWPKTNYRDSRRHVG